MTDHIKLGEFVRHTRKHRKWTLREMAKFCGVSFSTIARIENGEDCNFSALREVAQAFNMEVGDMLTAAGYTNGENTQRAAAIVLMRKVVENGLRSIDD